MWILTPAPHDLQQSKLQLQDPARGDPQFLGKPAKERKVCARDREFQNIGIGLSPKPEYVREIPWQHLAARGIRDI